MSLVSVHAVRSTAGSVVLVDDVSFDAAAGEMLAVIGPNGAGKSTLLGILAGDRPIEGGTVSIDGVAVHEADHRHLARLRSYLPQHRVADVPFTAYEVVAMGRYPLRRDPENSAAADAAAIATALDQTASAAFAGRVFATLSGGEQARVALARVLAQGAPVILLDEPTAALDVAHEERVMTELRSRAAAGAAVVAVLHDLNTAARYADRILVMAQGRIAASGPPADVLTDGLLSEIYAQPIRVVPHPFRDCPLVLVAD